jgi:hypothetical protein
MTWRIDYDEKHCIINVIYQGTVSKKDIHKSVISIVENLHFNFTVKILADFSRVRRLSITVLEIYELPYDFKFFGLSQNFIKALVISKKSKTLEKLKFYETVFVNNCHRIKIFEESKPAFEWLIAHL